MSVEQSIKKYKAQDKSKPKSKSKSKAKKVTRSAKATKASSSTAKPVKKAASSTKAVTKSTKTPKKKMELNTSKKKVSQAIETKEAAHKARHMETQTKETAAVALTVPQRKGSKLVRSDFSPANTSREQLILEYASLIKYIAQRIAARLPANIELDDLISSGVIGLMDAIDKFDESRDNKFKTYAEFRIRGAILDELRAQDWVPRSIREKAKQLERCYSKLEQEKGRHATDEEVCEELGISQEEYHDLLNQVRSVSVLSFDDISNLSRADKQTLHGSSGESTKHSNPFSEVNVASMKRLIADAIRDLPEKQRLVLSLYYYEDLNLKEIGRVLDVTESRVSQLHTQAILRLKGRLGSNADELFTLMA